MFIWKRRWNAGHLEKNYFEELKLFFLNKNVWVDYQCGMNVNFAMYTCAPFNAKKILLTYHAYKYKKIKFFNINLLRSDTLKRSLKNFKSKKKRSIFFIKN